MLPWCDVCRVGMQLRGRPLFFTLTPIVNITEDLYSLCGHLLLYSCGVNTCDASTRDSGNNLLVEICSNHPRGITWLISRRASFKKCVDASVVISTYNLHKSYTPLYLPRYLAVMSSVPTL